MSEHVRRQENAASDLEGAETVHRPDIGVRSEVAAADLKEEQRNQQRLQKLLAIDVAHPLHDHTIGVRPEDKCKVIREVHRQEDGNDAKRRYAVRNPQRRRRRIGGPWRGCLIAPEPRQRCHSKPERDPHPGVGHWIVQHGELDTEKYEQRRGRDRKQGDRAGTPLPHAGRSQLPERHRAKQRHDRRGEGQQQKQRSGS